MTVAALTMVLHSLKTVDSSGCPKNGEVEQFAMEKCHETDDLPRVAVSSHVFWEPESLMMNPSL
jgi:hypothetical protein